MPCSTVELKQQTKKQLYKRTSNAFIKDREILLEFHEEKCVYLPITSAKVLPTTEYALKCVILEIGNAKKDLCVWIDNDQDFDKHIITKVRKANRIIALTKKCFRKITLEIFSSIYKPVIDPILKMAITFGTLT